MPTGHKVQPSLWFALLGLPFFLAGIGGFVYFVYDGVNHVGEAFTQVVVPGNRELDLQAGRVYTVFHTTGAVIAGKVYTSESIEGLECRVTAANGSTAPLRPASTNFVLSTGSTTSRSILEFTALTTGRHTLACTLGADEDSQAVLSVASQLGEVFSTPLLKALLAGFGGALLGLGIAIGVVIAHFRAKARLRAAALT